MTIYKKGSISDTKVVSYLVYACDNCDYTEILNEEKEDNKCPKCQSVMVLLSSSSATK